MPKNVFKMTVNDTSNAVFALTGATGHQDRIYVYKYFISNEGEAAQRAQSSWSYWELESADEILQALCIRETLFCLVRYGNQIYLEKMPVQDRSPEPPTNAPYPLLLDRRVSTTTETPASMRVSAGTYNSNTKHDDLDAAVSRRPAQCRPGLATAQQATAACGSGNITSAERR